MIDQNGTLRSERVAPEVVFPELRKVSVFAELKEENISCLGSLELVNADAQAMIVAPGSPRAFLALLEGEVRIHRTEADGTISKLVNFKAGESFGEMPILMGSESGQVGQAVVEAVRESRVGRFE